MTDDADQVPADELRDLIDEWREVYHDFGARADGIDYNHGMSEGARSAAVELRRLVDRHTDEEVADD